MPRAKIDLGEKWEKAFEQRLAPAVLAKLRTEPMTESEMASFAIATAGAGLEGELKRLYSMQFSRSISGRTAKATVANAIRRVLSRVKAGLPPEISRSRGKIQIGRGERKGFLFFTSREAAAGKLKELYVSSRQRSVCKDALLTLERRNYLPLDWLPYQQAAIDKSLAPLYEFGVIERRIAPGGAFLALAGQPAAEPPRREGSAPHALLAEARKAFPPEAQMKEDFSASRWLAGPEGPFEKKLHFSLLVFEPSSGMTHLADISGKEAGAPALRSLREKAADLGLPALLHFFAPAFSKSAEGYARRQSIALHELRGAK